MSGYQYSDGTSMVTPHVSGAVAVLAGALPRESVSRRKSRILTGAEPLGSLSGKVATGGRLNLYNALLVYESSHGVVTGLGSYPINGGWIEAFSSDCSHDNWIRGRWTDYNTANGESRIATGDIDGGGKDEIIIGLGPIPGDSSIPGGYFEILDDDYTHLDWGRIRWKAYNSANGETWPAVQQK